MQVLRRAFTLSFYAWISIMVLLPFAIGGIAVATPFLPSLATWLKSLTLYDFFITPAFWYAILMCLVGVTIGPNPEEVNIPPYIGWLFMVAGIVIFLALVVGRFQL